MRWSRLLRTSSKAIRSLPHLHRQKVLLSKPRTSTRTKFDSNIDFGDGVELSGQEFAGVKEDEEPTALTSIQAQHLIYNTPVLSYNADCVMSDLTIHYCPSLNPFGARVADQNPITLSVKSSSSHICIVTYHLPIFFNSTYLNSGKTISANPQPSQIPRSVPSSPTFFAKGPIYQT